MEPTTQACALIGNQTGDLSLFRTTPNPLSCTSQGRYRHRFKVASCELDLGTTEASGVTTKPQNGILNHVWVEGPMHFPGQGPLAFSGSPRNHPELGDLQVVVLREEGQAEAFPAPPRPASPSPSPSCTCQGFRLPLLQSVGWALPASPLRKQLGLKGEVAFQAVN